MNATATTVRLFKAIALTVVGVFIAMGGLALILFQGHWLGVLPLVAGGYLVARIRPAIIAGAELNPYEEPYFLGIPKRSRCTRCNVPTLDKWRTFCVICEWGPGDPVNAASARADLRDTTQAEQQLRARLLHLYDRTDGNAGDSLKALWREIVQLEGELSVAYAERVRKGVDD